MNKELVAIFEYLEREKGIKREVVIRAIEESLQAAARKSVKGSSNVTVEIHPKTGEISVYCEKEIVDQVEMASMEISLEEARQLDPECEIGQFIDVQIDPEELGRIAAQKARQIIAGKLRSAERDVIYEEYRHRIHDLVSGTIKQFIKGSTIVVDLGKVNGILPARYYPKTEKYQVGDKVVALLYEVRDTDNGGAEVVLTRSHPEFVAQLLAHEIPEIEEGVVIVEQIVREAGYRTKLTVRSQDPKVDPIGACIGMRGTRVKNIVRELNNEKVDIIPYSSDPLELLERALEPIIIRKMNVDEETGSIAIVVEDEDYPKVIGKKGVNRLLVSRLVGRPLEVLRMSDYQKMVSMYRIEEESVADLDLDRELDTLPGVSSLILHTLADHGYKKLGDFVGVSAQDLASSSGITLEMAHGILETIRKNRGPKAIG